MKGFKHTGNGPRYGSFPKGKTPVCKAIGGIIKDNIVEAPGFSDFKSGGSVAPKRSKKQQRALSKAGQLLRKARGGKVPGVSNPMTPAQAMSGSVGFNRTPKIR